MKKLLLTLALVLGAITFVAAQPRAIGARLGYGVDFSYQHSLGENMINLEVGFPGFDGVSAACTYDWIFGINSWQEKGSWNWYAGVGAGVAFNGLVFDNNYGGNFLSVGVAGRIGVEYNFWFPMQLSLDWRPVVGPCFYNNFESVDMHLGGLYGGAIALGIRYNF